MSINDYRKQLQKKVEGARKQLKTRPRHERTPLNSSGLLDRKTAHDSLLQQLADPSKPAKQRLAALYALKGLTMASPTAAQWRPRFADALRAASEDPKVSKAALNTLVEMGDTRTRERLLAGLKDESAAIVTKSEAFDLLASDEHGDAINAARETIDDPIADQKTKTAALPLLARDAESVSRLRAAVADKGASRAYRKAAVNSLYALDKKALGRSRRAVSDNAQLMKHVDGLLDPRDPAASSKPRRRGR